MEPLNLFILSLLLLPIFSLTISPSATALSVPTAAPSPTPFPSPSPSAESPSAGEAAPTPSPLPSQNYISFSPSSHSLSQPPAPSPSNSPSQPPASSTNHALESICNATDYPNLCISTISPFLDGRTDPETVVGIAIKAAVEHAKSAASLAAKLALAPSPFASVFGDCKDSYDDAVENFESAMNALAERDAGTMNSMLSAAITDFGDCDDGLSGHSLALLDVDSVLTKMTSNCLAIGSLIH